jgi:hypothetical protein
MRKKYMLCFFCCLLLIVVGGGTATAQGTKTKKKVKPIICAVSNYYECSLDDGCQQKSAVELNAPQFFKLLLDKKEIHLLGRSAGENQVSKIKNLTLVNGVIIIQGAESGNSDRKDGIGWTISINEKTGKMAFTASGDETGYVGMGMCTVY